MEIKLMINNKLKNNKLFIDYISSVLQSNRKAKAFYKCEDKFLKNYMHSSKLCNVSKAFIQHAFNRYTLNTCCVPGTHTCKDQRAHILPSEALSDGRGSSPEPPNLQHRLESDRY